MELFANRIACLLTMFTLGAASNVLADTRFASFTFENDFFAGYDRHYTNGVQLALLADLDHAPSWLRSVSADPQMVVAIGQRIYTPTNTSLPIPDPGDRPYAGWAYVMGDLRTRDAPTIDHLSATLGVVGPASGARQAQDSVHRLLGENTPKGWDTQVRNRPTLMIGYERAWPDMWQMRLGSNQMDLGLRSGLSVGTPLTYAEAGAVLRYGANLPTDLPVTHVSLGPPRDGYRGATRFGWYVWLGLDAHAVGYNEFIQGSTYSGGTHVERENFGTDVQVGIAAAWPKARVGFTLVQRSREFVGQPGADRYGQLVVSLGY
jgi:lipid A 3-O-deacylase